MRKFVMPVLLVSAAAASADDLKYLANDEFSGGATAVVVGDVPLIHTAQLVYTNAFEPAGRKQTAAQQVDLVLEKVLATVRSAGGDPAQVIKLNASVAEADLVDTVRLAIEKNFAKGKRPAVGFVVGKLPFPESVVAIDAVAPCTIRVDNVKRVGASAKAVLPVGGADAAILPPGRRVYVSGQAEKGENPVEATRKTLASLRATLKWLGLKDTDVVQCRAFLTPMTAAKDIVKEFDTHFNRNTPPLVVVEWESSLPIEIELIAHVPGDAGQAAPIEFLTPPGMTTSPIYSRVTRVKSDRFIYAGGLVSSKSGNGEVQVADTFDRLRGILKGADSDFDHLVKATYYVADEDASGSLNKLRPRYYDPKRPPAASKAKVAGVGIKDRTLVLDMIAVPTRK